MPIVYGLEPNQIDFQNRAAVLRSEILGMYATDVDSNARFPKESVAALAREGFSGLCVAKEFGGAGQGPGVFAACN
jgi:alkylation response protein AidB-like acyl-CoA dehydrogenase